VSKSTVGTVTIGAVEILACVGGDTGGMLLGTDRWLSSSMSLCRRGAKRTLGWIVGSATTMNAWPTSRLA